VGSSVVLQASNPRSNREQAAAFDVPREIFYKWKNFKPSCDVAQNCQRGEVHFLIMLTVVTAAGLRVTVKFDWHIAAKKLQARYMHNEEYQADGYAILKDLNLPKNGLTFHVDEPAGPSGHVRLSIEQPAAFRLEATGIWDTCNKNIVIRPVDVANVEL
jgi:hypothetical protein